MCNLGMAIEMKGVERGMAKGLEKGIAQGLAQGITQGMAQGIETGLLSSIKNLMETLKLTATEAMAALKIPESEQPHYAALIGS